MATFYVYRDHLYGALFTAEEDFDSFCEQCFDSDDFVGTITADSEPSEEELKSAVYQ